MNHGLHRPVARIFYREVRSNEETDRTRLEMQVFGGAGEGELGCLRLHFVHFE